MTVHNHAFDEIKATLGNIPAGEYEQRRRIRDCRAWASGELRKPSGENSRSLLWMAIEAGTHFYLSGHGVEALTEAAEMCRDLVLIAEKARKLENHDGLA